MKKLTETKKSKKTASTGTNGTKTLFNEMSSLVNTIKRPLFEDIFDGTDTFVFVKPILSDDVVVFFQSDLSKNIIDSVMEDGISYEELCKVEDLSEYGIVTFTDSSKIRELLLLPNNSHCTKLWVEKSKLNVYCQIGANYCFNQFEL